MPFRFASLPALLLLALSVAAPVASADDDDDDDRRGRHKHGKHKETYWDGNCKVERKWKHGEYEEKRKCKGGGTAVVQAAPVVVYPPWIVVQQGAPAYQAAPAVPASGVMRCQSQSVGRVLGGLVGGVLGNQIGGGSGRALMTVGGVVTGVLVGGEVGRRIDANDQACVGQVLEFAPTGQRVQWASGPQQYAVVPGQMLPARAGRQCRSYTLEERTAQGWRRVTEKACRRDDGVWLGA